MNDWIEFLTFSAVAVSREPANQNHNMPERVEPKWERVLRPDRLHNKNPAQDDGPN